MKTPDANKKEESKFPSIIVLLKDEFNQSENFVVGNGIIELVLSSKAWTVGKRLILVLKNQKLQKSKINEECQRFHYQSIDKKKKDFSSH